MTRDGAPAGYRETRPVHGGAVVAGSLAAFVWFVVVGAVAWSPVSYVVATAIGLVPALIAAVVLMWRGSRGAGIGIALTATLVIAFLVVVLLTIS